MSRTKPTKRLRPQQSEANDEAPIGMLYGLGCMVVVLIMVGAATIIKLSIDFLFT